MPEGFFAIPDWFSHENQGAGIAVAELGDGQQHLVVLMVDNPVQQNRGIFRIGRKLDGEGRVTGGWTPWIDVPDWFSWENQGADIAVADLGRDGRGDLVVFMIDNGPQQNRGLYRVGKALDANGNVTGGWTPWIDVPDWFAWENQGGGIAVTPPDAQGRRHLVVFMIDNGPQQNRGLYRVGKALDANGNVTGGWTPWTDVPDWFAWENQGGGIAVTPPDAQGRRHLVVFMIDNGPQQNRGLYRVGKALDADGNVTGGWTPWTDVPDWFAWENQGGSVAVADLDGNGSQDMVVFMIDNVIPFVKNGVQNGGQNQGFFRIGRNLGAGGAVATWDRNWLGLPYWFSWENQGGGIDIARIQGKRKLFALLVDNPPGQNAGLYQVIDLEFDPAVSGRWEPVFELPNVAVHMHVLPNGKVLFWGRRDKVTDPLDPHECTPWVWDPATRSVTKTANRPHHADGRSVNLFCAGHAFLPDGRLLVAGGHLADSDGSDQASIYDYRTNSWQPLPEMNKGRWYPTVTALSDGTMLVISGSFIHGKVIINDVPQIWDGQRWVPTVDFIGLPLYPRMHVTSSGRVFMAGTNAKTYMLDTGTNTWTPLPEPGGSRRNGNRDYAPSVMYDTGKVIYIGGGNDQGSNIPTAEVEIIDLGANPPAWQPTSRMHFPRRQHNATLLPDGSILVTGGTMGHDFNDLTPGRPVHIAELWDPGTKTWRMLAAEDVDRCYHGTAVLLPDATVLSAGSGEFNLNGPGVPPKANDPADSHRNAQIFRPPYLFRGPRPAIASAPDKVDYGEKFPLEVSGPHVGQVTWIRLPSVTHAFNQNQIINFLEFSADKGRLTVKAPERPELCPPGHYMIFALSKAGVPSVALIMRIGPSTARARAAAAPTFAMDAMEGKTPTEKRDEAVRTQSTGTRVTVGLTARCPYGLGSCWGGAYEALKKLAGVAAVRPIPDAKASTADVYLRGQGLPDLDIWPAQLARWANRSYDFRGVEVTVAGTLREQDGTLQLTGPSFAAPLSLKPLGQGTKIQWNHEARRPEDPTGDEQDAYRNLQREYHNGVGRDAPVRITGPLTKTGAGWDLYVRKFER